MRRWMVGDSNFISGGVEQDNASEGGGWCAMAVVRRFTPFECFSC